MLHVCSEELSTRELHQFLLSGVAPRPVALVSTVSCDGIRNLSPFSFYNAFGANPPIVVVSPSRRGRDASLKDTYNNLEATRECVIHAVTYDMLHQVNLSSTEFPSDIDEFVKSGFTPVQSDLVRPERVAQSPFAMECRLQQIISLGEGGGAGNLAICEVVKLHISKRIMKDGVIEPDRLDLIGRMGADYYTRASGDSLFQVPKPAASTAIGFDGLPAFIQTSELYTANEAAHLAANTSLPTQNEISVFIDSFKADAPPANDSESSRPTGGHYSMLGKVLVEMESGSSQQLEHLGQIVKGALHANDVEFALRLALYIGLIQDEKW
ncbi:MAG: flavin reductase family protein [Candidatus Zixiibacteriota bacterium]